MIHITESYTGNSSMVIKVEGSLDRESLSIMEETYRKNRESGKEITIDFEDIRDIDRDAKGFLKSIRDKVQFVGLPMHIQIEIGSR